MPIVAYCSSRKEDRALVDSLDIHDDRDTYSLDLEAFYSDFNSFFQACTLGIAVVEAEEACTACTDYWVAYYFALVGDGYYLVDKKAWAYLDCSGFDLGACRAWDRDTVDTLGDIGPSAYALEEVDTYMVDNKKQEDSLDFYYYLGSYLLPLFQAQNWSSVFCHFFKFSALFTVFLTYFCPYLCYRCVDKI